MNNRITYIGHATLLLEIDGIRILTDPILRDWIAHLERRTSTVSPGLYNKIDAALISHLHLDHFDIPSLKMLGRDTCLIVPAGAEKLLKDKGFKNIQELYVGNNYKIGSLSVQATQAEHSSKYPPFGPTTDSLGYLVIGSQSVYFPGDTDIFPGMNHLKDNLDVALLPVWGWGLNLGAGHMNPYRAAEALTLLKPRIAIPIHWGTFYPRWLGWLRSRLLIEPPQIFQKEASKLAPQVLIHIIPPGSSFALE